MQIDKKLKALETVKTHEGVRRYGISVVRAPGGIKRENGQETIFEEILVENFLELLKDSKCEIKKATNSRQN